LVLAPFVPFFLLVATFWLPVATIDSILESFNCMGVMRNDVEGFVGFNPVQKLPAYEF